tara:strand:- start:81 stop:470 length:390 start_codon:yes stop_codon:yes gene_type:complete
MNTQTETGTTEAETKLNLLDDLFNDYLDDICVSDYLDDDEIQDINDAEELYEELIDSDAFNIEIIYYSRAMDYLSENDFSLSESIEIAVELGYGLEDINSELLATLHASEKAKEDFWLIKNDIDEILSR